MHRICTAASPQFMTRIQQLVDDMDRKIARHKERMEDENARAPQVGLAWGGGQERKAPPHFHQIVRCPSPNLHCGHQPRVARADLDALLGLTLSLCLSNPPQVGRLVGWWVGWWVGRR